MANNKVKASLELNLTGDVSHVEKKIDALQAKLNSGLNLSPKETRELVKNLERALVLLKQIKQTASEHKVEAAAITRETQKQVDALVKGIQNPARRREGAKRTDLEHTLHSILQQSGFGEEFAKKVSRQIYAEQAKLRPSEVGTAKFTNDVKNKAKGQLEQALWNILDEALSPTSIKRNVAKRQQSVLDAIAGASLKDMKGLAAGGREAQIVVKALKEQKEAIRDNASSIKYFEGVEKSASNAAKKGNAAIVSQLKEREKITDALRRKETSQATAKSKALADYTKQYKQVLEMEQAAVQRGERANFQRISGMERHLTKLRDAAQQEARYRQDLNSRQALNLSRNISGASDLLTRARDVTMPSMRTTQAKRGVQVEKRAATMRGWEAFGNVAQLFRTAEQARGVNLLSVDYAGLAAGIQEMKTEEDKFRQAQREATAKKEKALADARRAQERAKAAKGRDKTRLTNQARKLFAEAERQDELSQVYQSRANELSGHHTGYTRSYQSMMQREAKVRAEIAGHKYVSTHAQKLHTSKEEVENARRTIALFQKGGFSAGSGAFSAAEAAGTALDTNIQSMEKRLASKRVRMSESERAELVQSLERARAERKKHNDEMAKLQKQETLNIESQNKKRESEAQRADAKEVKRLRDARTAKHFQLLRDLAADPSKIRTMSLAELAETRQAIQEGTHGYKMGYYTKHGGIPSEGRIGELQKEVQRRGNELGRPSWGQRLWFHLTGMRVGGPPGGGGGGGGGGGFGGWSPFGRADNTMFHHMNKRVTNISQMLGTSLYGMGIFGAGSALVRGSIGSAMEKETMVNTLGGLINTFARFKSVTGDAITPAENFIKSIEYSGKVYDMVREKAVKSILTTREMFDYFMSGAPQLMAQGLNVKESLSIVDAIASIGKSMGLSSTAVQSDVRDLATGTVTVRSQVLRTMGFDRQKLADARAQGPQALNAYFNEVVAPFRPALKRLEGLTQTKVSAFLDQLQQFGIALGEKLAPKLIPILQDLHKTLNTWSDDGTLDKFATTFGTLVKGVADAIRWFITTVGPHINMTNIILFGIGQSILRFASGMAMQSDRLEAALVKFGGHIASFVGNLASNMSWKAMKDASQTVVLPAWMPKTGGKLVAFWEAVKTGVTTAFKTLGGWILTAIRTMTGAVLTTAGGILTGAVAGYFVAKKGLTSTMEQANRADEILNRKMGVGSTPEAQKAIDERSQKLVDSMAAAGYSYAEIQKALRTQNQGVESHIRNRVLNDNALYQNFLGFKVHRPSGLIYGEGLKEFNDIAEGAITDRSVNEDVLARTLGPAFRLRLTAEELAAKSAGGASLGALFKQAYDAEGNLVNQGALNQFFGGARTAYPDKFSKMYSDYQAQAKRGFAPDFLSMTVDKVADKGAEMMQYSADAKVKALEATLARMDRVLSRMPEVAGKLPFLSAKAGVGAEKIYADYQAQLARFAIAREKFSDKKGPEAISQAGEIMQGMRNAQTQLDELRNQFEENARAVYESTLQYQEEIRVRRENLVLQRQEFELEKRRNAISNIDTSTLLGARDAFRAQTEYTALSGLYARRAGAISVRQARGAEALANARNVPFSEVENVLGIKSPSFQVSMVVDEGTKEFIKGVQEHITAHAEAFKAAGYDTKRFLSDLQTFQYVQSGLTEALDRVADKVAGILGATVAGVGGVGGGTIGGRLTDPAAIRQALGGKIGDYSPVFPLKNPKLGIEGRQGRSAPLKPGQAGPVDPNARPAEPPPERQPEGMTGSIDGGAEARAQAKANSAKKIEEEKKRVALDIARQSEQSRQEALSRARSYASAWADNVRLRAEGKVARALGMFGYSQDQQHYMGLRSGIDQQLNEFMTATGAYGPISSTQLGNNYMNSYPLLMSRATKAFELGNYFGTPVGRKELEAAVADSPEAVRKLLMGLGMSAYDADMLKGVKGLSGATFTQFGTDRQNTAIEVQTRLQVAGNIAEAALTRLGDALQRSAEKYSLQLEQARELIGMRPEDQGGLKAIHEIDRTIAEKRRLLIDEESKTRQLLAGSVGAVMSAGDSNQRTKALKDMLGITHMGESIFGGFSPFALAGHIQRIQKATNNDERGAAIRDFLLAAAPKLGETMGKKMVAELSTEEKRKADAEASREQEKLKKQYDIERSARIHDMRVARAMRAEDYLYQAAIDTPTGIQSRMDPWGYFLRNEQRQREEIAYQAESQVQDAMYQDQLNSYGSNWFIHPVTGQRINNRYQENLANDPGYYDRMKQGIILSGNRASTARIRGFNRLGAERSAAMFSAGTGIIGSMVANPMAFFRSGAGFLEGLNPLKEFQSKQLAESAQILMAAGGMSALEALNDPIMSRYIRQGPNGSIAIDENGNPIFDRGRAINNALGELAGSIGGQMGGAFLGQALFPGKDPAAIQMGASMGTTLGGVFASALNMAGPWGMLAGGLVGGLLGGLFGGKKKDPEEERRKQLNDQRQKRVEELLSRIDKSLRPQADYFRTIKGEVLFGTASRWYSGRAYADLGLQGALSGR